MFSTLIVASAGGYRRCFLYRTGRCRPFRLVSEVDPLAATAMSEQSACNSFAAAFAGWRGHFQMLLPVWHSKYQAWHTGY
jgi:hypothetical protein